MAGRLTSAKLERLLSHQTSHNSRNTLTRREWPDYSYDASNLSERVEHFYRCAERIAGQVEALSEGSREHAVVDLMLSEAVTTSAIEGENLDRDSVRSSLLNLMGRETVGTVGNARAAGAAALIVDVRQNWNRPLSHEILGRWQSMVIVEQFTSRVTRGAYRNSPEPMQIISGRSVVHYEAPPADQVLGEMQRFLDWYNSGSPVTGSGEVLPGPVRAVNTAQDIARAEVAFVLDKTRFYDRYGEKLNERQGRVIARMFQEGRAGFTSGLSAKNYVSITRCSPATATRDLTQLRDMGALLSRGRGRGTRYEISRPKAGTTAGW